MFLEFWPNRFIKIAVDENVFFSVNSREIGGNTRFGYELIQSSTIPGYSSDKICPRFFNLGIKAALDFLF